MNSRQLEAFQAVARTGTVTAAADMLHISQPAVSRLLSHLEMQLSLALFTRHRGRLHLTPEGSAFLREVDRHFVGLDSIESAARQIATHGPGNLRVLAFPSLTSGVLPVAVAKFLEAHPGTTVTLDTDTTDRISARIDAGAYDVGFTAGDAQVGSALDAHAIESRPWVCVLPATHPLADKPRLSMRELTREPMIGFSPGMSLRDRIQRLFSDHGLSPTYILSAQTIESICGLVQSGCGTAVIHPYATHVARSRGLVSIPLAETATLDLVGIKPQRPSTPRIVDEFVEMVRHELDSERDMSSD